MVAGDNQGPAQVRTLADRRIAKGRTMVDTPDLPSAATGAAGADEVSSRPLSEIAKRALAEAEDRRRARDEAAGAEAARREVGGRNGPDPVRYGDWEKDGIISDF
jgi:hypothetical protein